MPLPRATWIALTISLTLALVFTAWAVLALSGGRLQSFDDTTALTFRNAAADHDLRREIMIGFTHLGGVPAMTLLALAGVLWQWRRGDIALAVAWAAIVAGGAALNVALKTSLDRQRPPAEWRDPAVTETNESFPSGHSMGSLIGYGMLGCATLPHLRRRPAKVAVVLLLAGAVGLIGFSRIYLRAHWFSDVIGGFVVGAAWLAFGLAWVESACAHRKSNS